MYTTGVSNSKESHTLVYPLSKLDLSMKKNEICKGNLTFEVKPGCEISGFLYATHYRMRCGEKKFKGEDLKLSYVFDSTGMEEGDTVKGDFILITSIGEYSLPFEVTVLGEEITSSIGEIRNLFHFVNLARTDWKEAVGVFYHPCFEKLFVGSDRQFKSAYRGLSGNAPDEAAVEEFLILIRKKQAVTYSLEESEKVIKGTPAQEYSFFVVRNNWGYTRLELKTNADFIRLDKDVLTEEDFKGGRAVVTYQIDEDRLHGGKNFGEILLKGVLDLIQYRVAVDCSLGLARRGGDRKRMKQLNVQLLDEYIHFRFVQDREKWLEAAEEIVTRMVSINGRNLYARLLQAELYLDKGYGNEAKWILRHVDDLLENQEEQSNASEEEFIRAYRSYLDGLVAGDEAELDKAVEKLQKFYRKHPDCLDCFRWLVALDDILKKDVVRQLQMMDELFCMGNRSPLLYLEAYFLYKEKPSYLDELDGMGLQVLLFAAKYHMLTKELIEQINYLALKKKELTKPIYCLLEMCCEGDETTETLRVLCTLLIKNEKAGQEYFKWYEEAVREELRITRLYEYYLLSVDLSRQELLPKMLLMYFAYQCELDYVHAAYLYANVLRHGEEIPEICESYAGQIEHFVFRQVGHGHINEDLAYLYKRIICESMIDEDFAKSLIRLLFTHQVLIADSDIKYIVLVEEKRCREQKFPVTGSVVSVPVYDEEYAILLERADKRRFAVSIPFQEKELFVKQRFWSMVEEYAQDNIGACLYFCRNHVEISQVNERQRGFFTRLYEEEDCLHAYRKEIGMELMKYYYDYDNTGSLDPFLENVELSALNREERAEVIRLLVIRDQHEKAYESIGVYGLEGIPTKQLLKLFRYGQEKDGTGKNDRLSAIAEYLLERGKYEEDVLQYLVEHYEGSIRKMRTIWEEAVGHRIPAKKLAEKIISQTLFDGAYVARRQEIFAYYYQEGADPKLVREYLSQCAYRYFVMEQVMDENVFAMMLEMTEPPQICKIAVVHFFSANPADISRQEKEKVCAYIKELLAEDVYFPFFNRFSQYIPILLPMAEKTFIEYRTTHRAKVVLHYVSEGSEEGEAEYCREEMPEIYEGYYCQSFLLFFGEKLQYYITESVDGTERLTESGTIEKSDTLDFSVEGRFNLLNQIVMSQSLNEQEAVRDLALEYARQSFLTAKLFEIR